MRHTLSTEQNLLDTSLDKVLPLVQQWHSANQQAVIQLINQFASFAEDVKSAAKEIKETSTSSHKKPNCRSSTHFLPVQPMMPQCLILWRKLLTVILIWGLHLSMLTTVADQWRPLVM